MPNKLVTFRYSLFYFFNLGKYAFIIGYLPLYGHSLGFTSVEIAILSSAGILAGMTAPLISINLAHFRWSPSNITRIGCTMNCFIFFCLFYVKSFLAFFTLWILFMFIDISSSSIVEAHALRESAKKRLSFERIRTWGSIGFIALGILLGSFADYLNSAVLLPIMFVNIILVACTLHFLSPLLPNKPNRHFQNEQTKGSFSRARKLSFIFVVLSTALIWASHGVIYVYLSLYLKSLGWTGSMISVAWNIGVLSEIVLFIYFEKIQKILGLEKVLFISALSTIIRLIILGSTSNTVILLLSQTLHAWSFGGVYLASQRLVSLIVPETLHDRSQGYLMSFGTSSGSLVGRVLAGTLAWGITDYTLVQPMFLKSAVPAAAALGITLFLMRRSQGIENKQAATV